MLDLRKPLSSYDIKSRNIFPFSMEKVVLYFPFWQEDVQGTPILSYDQYRHVGAVTGATWGSTTGRTFDGGGAADDFIQIPDAASVRNIFNAIAGGTAIAWINVASDGEGSDGHVYRKPTGNYISTNSQDDSKVKLTFAVTFSGDDGLWRTTGTEVTTNTMTHIAVTFSAASANNNPIFYVNGTLVVSEEIDTPTGVGGDDTGEDLFVGNFSSAVRTLDGSIKELWLWKDLMLSASEILNHYEITKGGV